MHLRLMAHASLLLPSPVLGWPPASPSALRFINSSSCSRPATPLMALCALPPLQQQHRISDSSPIVKQRTMPLSPPQQQHSNHGGRSANASQCAVFAANSSRTSKHGRRPATTDQLAISETGITGAAGEQQYFATCHPGLENVVAAELQAPQIGAHGVRLGKAGVYFRRAQHRRSLRSGILPTVITDQ